MACIIKIYFILLKHRTSRFVVNDAESDFVKFVKVAEIHCFDRLRYVVDFMVEQLAQWIVAAVHCSLRSIDSTNG